MKAILEFNLPEEKEAHQDALNGSKYKDRIDSLYDRVFRPIIKYDKPIVGDELKSPHLKIVQAIWDRVNEHLTDEK